MAGIAKADPAKLPENQPVALFVDVSEDQIAAVKDLKTKQLDLNGIPVLLGTGPNNDVGLKTGRGVDLGSGFSLETSGSISRSVVASDILTGSGEIVTGTVARFKQSGWDISLFPEIGTTQLDASRLPDYVIGGSVARQVAGGWGLKASSRYAARRAATWAGGAGTAASGAFGFTHLPLRGTTLDLGYYYDGSQPKTETATSSQGPTVALDFDLADTLNCRVAYRYEFAGDLRGNTPDLDWLGDGGQDLTVGWNWDLASEGIRGTTFSADFAYHQDFFAAAAPASGSGGINLGMAF